MAKLDSSNVNPEAHSDENRQDIQQSVPLEASEDVQDAQLTTYKRQRMLYHSIEHYTAASAPHKRLTDDILREIFHLVALSTGELWSNVNVSVRYYSTSKTMKVWLKRARKFLVYLQLNVSSDYRLNRTAIFKYLFSNIRIACLDLSINVGRLSELSVLPDDVLQDIKEVRLWTNLFSKAKPPPLPSFVRHTRFLCCADSVTKSDLNVSEFALPWDQIRYLDLNGLHILVSQYLRFLRHMISSEECRLPVSELQDDNLAADQQTELTLPRLKILVLWLFGNGPIGALNNLVRVLRTPRLRKLTMTGEVTLGVATMQCD
ncbi:hypothetical protein AX17_006452 [Amanita inopinata Kibby_2008]|nr:hypothetical protein AX17_006452 [Amanita inopinata Kibby_2008]